MKVGVQAIIKKIKEDAENDSMNRFEHGKVEADKESDEDLAMFRSEIDKRKDMLTKHKEHEHALNVERRASRLQRELLAYRKELLDNIFTAAVIKLRNISDKEFETWFSKSISDLKGSYTLLLGEFSKGKLDKEKIDEILKLNKDLKINFSGESIPKKSGFMLFNDLVEYNNLFEDLVDDINREKSALIAKEVFSE